VTKQELQRIRFEVFAGGILGLNLRRTVSGLYRKATTRVGWVCWQEAQLRKKRPKQLTLAMERAQ
jgi:hypothetical protein